MMCKKRKGKGMFPSGKKPKNRSRETFRRQRLLCRQRKTTRSGNRSARSSLSGTSRSPSRETRQKLRIRKRNFKFTFPRKKEGQTRSPLCLLWFLSCSFRADKNHNKHKGE